MHMYLVLKVDVSTVTLLKDSLMKVVAMVDSKIPTTNFRDGHVVPAYRGCLDFPDDV